MVYQHWLSKIIASESDEQKNKIDDITSQIVPIHGMQRLHSFLI